MGGGRDWPAHRRDELGVVVDMLQHFLVMAVALVLGEPVRQVGRAIKTEHVLDVQVGDLRQVQGERSARTETDQTNRRPR